MRTTIMLIIGLAAPASALGQRYTPAEQEVLDRVRQCASIFETSGFGRTWMQECSHPDYRYWRTGEIMPQTRTWIERSGRESQAKRFAEQRPIVIAVHGDVAYMFSNWVLINENAAGERTTIQRHTINVFKREGRKWLFLAEYESPDLAVGPKAAS